MVRVKAIVTHFFLQSLFKEEEKNKKKIVSTTGNPNTRQQRRRSRRSMNIRSQCVWVTQAIRLKRQRNVKQLMRISKGYGTTATQTLHINVYARVCVCVFVFVFVRWRSVSFHSLPSQNINTVIIDAFVLYLCLFTSLQSNGKPGKGKALSLSLFFYCCIHFMEMDCKTWYTIVDLKTIFNNIKKTADIFFSHYIQSRALAKHRGSYDCMGKIHLKMERS